MDFKEFRSSVYERVSIIFRLRNKNDKGIKS